MRVSLHNLRQTSHLPSHPPERKSDWWKQLSEIIPYRRILPFNIKATPWSPLFDRRRNQDIDELEEGMASQQSCYRCQAQTRAIGACRSLPGWFVQQKPKEPSRTSSKVTPMDQLYQARRSSTPRYRSQLVIIIQWNHHHYHHRHGRDMA